MSTALRIDRIDKNYLINGGMDFFQRNGATSFVNLSTTPSYTAPDRFKVSYTGTVTGTPNIQRVTNTLNPAKAKYAVQFNGQRNASTLVFTMEQRIEGIEARELAYTGTASFSVWVFTPISGCSVQLTLNTPTVEDNYTSVTQLSQQTSSTTITASTWTKITFSGLAISSAANFGLAVIFALQIPSGTDGSAQNHLMTQFIANAGTSAADFTRSGKSIGQELKLCQRYFDKSYDPDVPPGTAAGSGSVLYAIGQTSSASLYFTATMNSGLRVAPITFTVYAPNTGTSGNVFDTSNAANAAASLAVLGRYSTTFFTSAAAILGHGYDAHWSVDAEL